MRSLIRAAVILAAVALPATAVASASAPAAPKTGPWSIVTNGYSTQLTGGFTVAKAHKVTGLQGTLGPDAETACGTGQLTVGSSPKITQEKTRTKAGNDWIVGKYSASSDPTLKPVSVPVTVGGQTVQGKLWLVLSAHLIKGGQLDGDLTYSGGSAGNCELEFVIKKG